MTKEKKLPYKKLDIAGGLKLVFWEEEVDSNGKKFNVLKPVLNKSWKKKDSDEWENLNISLDMNTLFRLLAMGSKVKQVEDDFKEKQKV